MANVKITDLPSLTGANSASTDVLPVVDVSTDTTSKMTRAEFFLNVPAVNVAANSSTAAVTITQTGTGNALVVEDSTSPDSTPFAITATGNVGIGTLVPAVRLEVSDGPIRLQGLSGDPNYYTTFTQAYGGDGSFTISHFYTGYSPEKTVLKYIPGASPNLGLYTGGTERLRIDASGNVGIGATAPSSKLELRGASPQAITISHTDGTNYDTTITATYSAAQSFNLVSAGTSVLSFRPTDSAAVIGAILRLERGTSAPTLWLNGASGTDRVGIKAGSGGLGAMEFYTAALERFRFGASGQFGIGGANYGTTGQTIVSAGSGAAPAWGTLPVAGGGTGVTTAPAEAARILGYTATATAAGTTVLTNTSTQHQLFTGSTTQTITLPVTSTLVAGWSFHIVNNSTGDLTVNSSGGNLVVTIIAGLSAMVTCIGTTLTTAADWEAGLTDFQAATGTGSVVLGTGPTITAAALNGTVGATTPSTGAFTTLSASSTVSGTGFSTYLASPPAIGGTTPASIRGSSLTSDSIITDGYIAHANGTLALAFGTDGVCKVTPTATGTFTSTVPAAGTRTTLIVLTSGTTSYTMTFGTGFKTTGTLATGTVAARYFVFQFISDGTSLIECSRTVAIA